MLVRSFIKELEYEPTNSIELISGIAQILREVFNDRDLLSFYLYERSEEICNICYGEYTGRTLKGFIRYCIAKQKVHAEEMIYREYVTETLKFFADKQGADIDRYYDIIHGNTSKTSENQAVDTAETAKKKVLAEFERLGGGKNGCI